MLPEPFCKLRPRGLYISSNCSPSMPGFAGNRLSPLLYTTYIWQGGGDLFLPLLAILVLYNDFALLC
jgi:hypothetical protein